MADKLSASARIAQLRAQDKKGVQILATMRDEGYTMAETKEELKKLGYLLHDETGQGHILLHISDFAMEAGLAVLLLTEKPLTMPCISWPTTARADN